MVSTATDQKEQIEPIRIAVDSSVEQILYTKLNDLVQAGKLELVKINANYSDDDQLQLTNDLQGYHGVVLRSGIKLRESTLRDCVQLELIVRPGAGVDNIDVDVASELERMVVNTPGTNAASVAELTYFLMGSLARYIPTQDSRAKGGEDEKAIRSDISSGIELQGTMLSIIGAGNVGARLAARALGHGMRVTIYDEFMTNDEIKLKIQGIMSLEQNSSGIKDESFLTIVESKDSEAYEALISGADFLSVHVDLNQSTRGLISQEELGKMKKTAYVLNSAREGIVDEDDLVQALDQMEIAGVGFDMAQNANLRNHERAIITAHAGAKTLNAETRSAEVAAQRIREYVERGKPEYCLNIPILNEKSRPFYEFARQLAFFASQYENGSSRKIEKLTLEYNGVPCHPKYLESAIAAGFLHGLNPSKVILEPTAESELKTIMDDRKLEVKAIRKKEDIEGMDNYLRVVVGFQGGDEFEIFGGRQKHGPDDDEPNKIYRIGKGSKDSIPLVAGNPYVAVRHSDITESLGSIAQFLGANGLNIYSGVGNFRIKGDVGQSEENMFVSRLSSAEASAIKDVLGRLLQHDMYKSFVIEASAVAMEDYIPGSL